MHVLLMTARLNSAANRHIESTNNHHGLSATRSLSHPAGIRPSTLLLRLLASMLFCHTKLKALPTVMLNSAILTTTALMTGATLLTVALKPALSLKPMMDLQNSNKQMQGRCSSGHIEADAVLNVCMARDDAAASQQVICCSYVCASRARVSTRIPASIAITTRSSTDWTSHLQ